MMEYEELYGMLNDILKNKDSWDNVQQLRRKLNTRLTEEDKVSTREFMTLLEAFDYVKNGFNLNFSKVLTYDGTLKLETYLKHIPKKFSLKFGRSTIGELRLLEPVKRPLIIEKKKRYGKNAEYFLGWYPPLEPCPNCECDAK